MWPNRHEPFSFGSVRGRLEAAGALALTGQRFDDIDAIAAFADDLYSKELDPPVFYP